MAPTAPSIGTIAFSSGGRIHLMGADGTGRVRLTGGKFAVEEGGGDSDPAWAPDGSTLAFVRGFETRSGEASSRIHLINTASGQTRQLAVPGDVFSPSWSPDGRIAFVRAFEDATALVVVNADGGAERELLRVKSGGDAFNFLYEPAWSPDGTRIAYTITSLDRRRYFRPALYVMDVQTGVSRLLAHDASAAAWSPDSTRIAFASVRDRNGKRCYEQCTYMGELYLMDADGSDPVRLTRNRGDDRSPAWAPDGQRIAFTSDRNLLQPGGQEIYTVAPDGSCLTWVTNGSPGSGDPAWRGSVGATAAPSCGVIRRVPRVEVRAPSPRELRGDAVYWLGRRYGKLLLAGADTSRRGGSVRAYFYYADCAAYEPRRCPPALQFHQRPVCSRTSTLGLVSGVRYRGRPRIFASRGRLFIARGRGELAVIGGDTDTTIFGTGGRRRLMRAARSLRRIGEPRMPLPPPALPQQLLSTLSVTEQAYARLGSIAAVADALGERPALIERRLQLVRALRSLPPVPAVKC
jgi:hypothetical protein